jgi:hypothetical protein
VPQISFSQHLETVTLHRYPQSQVWQQFISIEEKKDRISRRGMDLATSGRRKKVIADRVHKAALAAVVRYAHSRLSSVRAHPLTLPAEAQGVLDTVWLTYVLALRMAYGVLPASERDIARERLEEVISQVRRAIEEMPKYKRVVKQFPYFANDLRDAEYVSRNLAASYSAKRIVTSDRQFPSMPGAVQLLTTTNPTVLMRRAAICQLLRGQPHATQKKICGNLDFHGCPIPPTWREHATGWMTSYGSKRLHPRVKKLLSDDIDELKKWGAL